MAKREGFKRLTHLISLLTTVSVFILLIMNSVIDMTKENRMEVGFVYLVFSSLAYGIPWVLFKMLDWIIKGFKERE
ncbi:MAG: hypothetical protein IIA58_01755 [Candidatus Marinimicrobia bacterium]|nr:hypothetical protein [Candidatus Neomarinimicrobiota bacterium]